jgi:hypothetical protein
MIRECRLNTRDTREIREASRERDAASVMVIDEQATDSFSSPRPHDGDKPC